jgi:hypothetical protein
MSESSDTESLTPSPDTPFQVLADSATDNEGDDHLNFARYADALAFLIDQKNTSTPLTLAISAAWGAGKTTLANLVAEQLREKVAWDEGHIIYRFNAWKYDDAPNLGAAFAGEVARHANSERPWWSRLAKPLPSPMLSPEQRWWRRVFIIAVTVAIVALIVLGRNVNSLISALLQPFSDKNWESVVGKAHGFVAVLIAAVLLGSFLFPKIYSGMRALSRFIDAPGAEAAQGSIDSIRNELGKLIRSATRGRRRFIIFVDDLERCRPPRAVEVCEVASQLLDHKDVVTVFVADMETVAMSAAIKYRDLELYDSDRRNTAAYSRYGHAYLQKLVQIQFDLPPVSPDSIRNMLLTSNRQQKSSRETASGKPAKRLSDRFNSRSFVRIILFAMIAGIVTANFFLYTSFLVRDYYLVVARDKSLHRKVPPAPAYLGFVPSVDTSLIIVFASLLIAFAPVWGGLLMRGRVQRRRRDVDRAISELPFDNDIEKTVRQVASSQPRVSVSYIRRRIFVQWLINLQKSGIATRIERLVLEFLPERPRAAKRLMNEVRLITVVAISRGLFNKDQGSGRAANRPEWLAKWLILRERWPAVVYKITQDPAILERLEKAQEIQDILEELNLSDLDGKKDLDRLLKIQPPFGIIDELMMLGGPPADAQRAAL